MLQRVAESAAVDTLKLQLELIRFDYSWFGAAAPINLNLGYDFVYWPFYGLQGDIRGGMMVNIKR